MMFRNPMVLGLVLSVAVHLATLLSMKKWTPPPPEAPETIEITLQDKNKNSPEAAFDDEQNRQIVEQNEQLNDEIDENAKYLGKHNQRVVKETKAAAHGKLNNTAAGRLTSPAQPRNKNGRAAKKPGLKAASDGTLPVLSQLKPNFDWEALPNQGNNPQQSQVSRQNDYLKDVDRGIQTMLSTREFVYHTYYSRIKDRLQQYWEPKIKEKVERIFRSGRTIASAGDKITELLIVLDRHGVLQKVRVVGASGVHDLDDAAIEAFKAAAPFPNPPKGMIEKDGTVVIHWNFVLEA